MWHEITTGPGEKETLRNDGRAQEEHVASHSRPLPFSIIPVTGKVLCLQFCISRAQTLPPSQGLPKTRAFKASPIWDTPALSTASHVPVSSSTVPSSWKWQPRHLMDLSKVSCFFPLCSCDPVNLSWRASSWQSSHLVALIQQFHIFQMLSPSWLSILSACQEGADTLRLPCSLCWTGSEG